MFQKGAWIVLTGLGGELGRVFVPYTPDGYFTKGIMEALTETGWELDPGDTVTIEEGESEV